VSFTMTSGGSVSALSYTTKSISLLPSPILWTQCSLLLDNRQSEEWSLW
jgi:hypothetical protein